MTYIKSATLENILAPAAKARISTPVIALALYAVASGYLMSPIPLMLPNMGRQLISELASKCVLCRAAWCDHY